MPRRESWHLLGRPTVAKVTHSSHGFVPQVFGHLGRENHRPCHLCLGPVEVLCLAMLFRGVGRQELVHNTSLLEKAAKRSCSVLPSVVRANHQESCGQSSSPDKGDAYETLLEHPTCAECSPHETPVKIHRAGSRRNEHLTETGSASS
jgi:hypothetical protein